MEGHHLDLTQELVLIGALGIGAQWAAWALRLPGIVLLVAAGLLVGPVLGIVDPARDFGGLLRPFVHIAVALILFEGGLTLHYHEFRAAATGVRRLVTVGAVLGFVFAALAARYVAGLPWPVALVLGAILVVTGPTVIVPLLRQARLARRPASFLKWEGNHQRPDRGDPGRAPVRAVHARRASACRRQRAGSPGRPGCSGRCCSASASPLSSPWRSGSGWGGRSGSPFAAAGCRAS